MPDHDFRAQRLFVREDLQAGHAFSLPHDQAHYVANVIRLPVGGVLLLFNGRDGEWRATRGQGGKKDVRLEVEAQVRPQPAAPTLTYAFAPLKHARLDYMVQKAVEMGAGVLAPVLTQHTQVSRVNSERMEANAVEAAEQCGILSLPEVRAPIALAAFLTALPEGESLVFCDEAAPVADPVMTLAPLKGRRVTVLIGPEGGFSADERTLLMRHPAVTVVALGPRILRADTAGVAALALVQAACGDWGHPA
ncbi:ribosomal RNA small subunit methyltransferase E [Azorhizobium oxalatiphilum]|uniref:Ribosomal RNA small subunit methyltransferase E n=1 Tax=Azorhizobium oxalatiphilum TaxID=980631 RepID=A0A917BXB7_9HYPH|nr:16S rRNA (uracil(1498)-N(3))-methyltransferase [Azorhizobium oxalatiphilum]GGF60233.1 ribosomal RNA small subunit methyltransferase E [Azorhizobium oxalatiphilum]